MRLALLLAALSAAVAAADPQPVAEKRVEPRPLDSNNLLRQMDMPDYKHKDPCNLNLDLDAHSIGHHGSGLADEDTWSRPPPSFRCPPPSPPSAAPPALSVQSVDGDADGGPLPPCELPAKLDDYQRNGNWSESLGLSLCLLSDDSVAKGVVCADPRTPTRCASTPRVPSGYEFVSATGAGRFTISAGVKASCVHNSRALHCWGSNEGDKLSLHNGIRGANGGYTPTEQAGWTRIVETRNDSVVEIHIGAVFSCALRGSAVVTCFGGDVASSGDFVWHRARTTRYGARRKIEYLKTHVDFAFEGSQKVVQFDLQEVHTCLVGSEGGLACIGENVDGQLGDGTTWGQWGYLNPTRYLRPLNANAGVLEVATGYRHTCVLTTERTVICWGDNAEGQLGLGHRRPLREVAQMRALQPIALGGAVQSIAAGDEFNCAIVEPLGASDGKTEVRCWGRNNFGQLGLGDTRSRGVLPGELGADNLPPTPFDNVYGKNLAPARSLELGRAHACVLTVANELKCWGYNAYGQLGLGDRVSRGDQPNELFRSKETYVGRFDRPYAVSAGERHTCILSYEGETPDPQTVAMDGPCIKCFGGATHRRRRRATPDLPRPPARPSVRALSP
jgi:alpha-tubulin suppressor-like RCC1 family protein